MDEQQQAYGTLFHTFQLLYLLINVWYILVQVLQAK